MPQLNGTEIKSITNKRNGEERGNLMVWLEFARAIMEGRKPLVDGEDGMKFPKIVFGIYKSALENRPIRPPFEFGMWDINWFFKK